MADQPNPEDFSVNDKPREYEIRIRVWGEIHRTIRADSLEEAEAQADLIADVIAVRDPEEPDEIDDVQVISVRRATPMFRVMRDGKAMQVSRLCAGDTPREAGERGF